MAFEPGEESACLSDEDVSMEVTPSRLACCFFVSEVFGASSKLLSLGVERQNIKPPQPHLLRELFPMFKWFGYLCLRMLR